MRIERLRSNYQINLRWTYYPLHPDIPEEGMTLEQLLPAYKGKSAAMQERMSLLMSYEGLPYRNHTKIFNTRLAQELAKWAETQNKGDRLQQALYRACFVEEKNIGQLDVLVQIATSLDFSEEEVRKVLTNRLFRESVDADWERARNLGVTGVPTFVLGNQGVVGAQPYDQLSLFLEQAGAIKR